MRAIAEEHVGDPLNTWPDHIRRHRMTIMQNFLHDEACLRCYLEEISSQKIESRIKKLETDLFVAKAIADTANNKLSCNHFEVYAYTEDGGKNIVCTICEMKKLQAQLRAVYVLMYTASLPDGPEPSTVCSVGMMLVPNELKGSITNQEFDLAIMKTQGKVS